MRRLQLCFLYILSFLLAVQTGFGQNKNLVSGDFVQIKFDKFINTIKGTIDYHFYYNPSDLDSFYVNIKVKDVPVADLLQQIFQYTPYHVAITSSNIYVTKRYVIQIILPTDFFDKSKTNSSIEKEEEEINDNKRTGKEKIKTSFENQFFEIGNRAKNSQGNATLAGYVRDVKNGEPITGTSIYIDSLSVGVITDQFGYYSLTLPRGRHILQVNSVGMKNTSRHIAVYSDGKLNIELEDYVPSLKEVVVVSEKNSNVRSMQMGMDRLTIKTIKQVPVVFGEADVLKVVLTLPGVTSVGEAGNGFNVRGGSTDQNLIMLNDATIYNPSHLFGFFSAFNPDVIKGVELYKSAIPEKYGGRLSSVLDVTTKEGNAKKVSGTGGIGLLTSKLEIEGPIIKDKTSFIASGRTTYSNWLLHNFTGDAYKNSSASFSDIDLHISHTINNKNNLYLNGYWSNDAFKLNNDTLYKYSNRNANIKWKHIFNNQLYDVLTAGIDYYQYSVSSSSVPVNAYKLSFDIKQTYLRADFTYTPNSKHSLNFGLNAIYYQLHPGSFEPIEKQSLVAQDILPAERALESAFYLGDQYALTSKFSIHAGIRYSLFNYLGPHDVYNYVPGIPKDKNSILDTTYYGSGKIIKTYGGPEYRLMLRYSLTDNASLKLSYNTLRQYIHMLANTTAISPTDVWKLSDPHIKPQYGDQLSLGFYRNFKSNTIETSVEIYYKRLKDYLDYKSGATLILNHHIETDVINTKGVAYGAELMIKKTSGKLNGWINYTYSRTFLQTDDALASEVVNEGKYYPANFDKPHSANLITNYRFSHRYSMSVNVIYSTGRPITLPIAIYDLAGGQRVLYSDRNQYRVPDYFRSDFSFNIESNHKIKQLAHNSWSFGVYNITGRKNPYSVYFTQVNGTIKGYQLSIFGSPIPFVTYNFRF